MLTKIDCINLIQIELASGKITADLWQKFPIPVISRVLNAVMDEICMKNPTVRNAISVPRELSFVDDGFGSWVATVDPKPQSGVYSFSYISDDAVKAYTLRTNALNNTLSVLNPSASDFCILTTSAQLKFPCKPNGTLIAAYVPSVADMADEDELILPGSEFYLLQATKAFFLARKDMAQEILNDSKVDAG